MARPVSPSLAVGADLKVVQDMLGHAGIVLTADTFTSVLPQVALKTAEDTASLIIAAGCLVPGHPETPPTRLAAAALSRPHPDHRRPQPRPPGSADRGTASRPAHTLNSRGTAIRWPTSAQTSTAAKVKTWEKSQVRTGTPPGTRTSNPRIKIGKYHLTCGPALVWCRAVLAGDGAFRDMRARTEPANAVRLRADSSRGPRVSMWMWRVPRRILW
jgi:hypothetical protein